MKKDKLTAEEIAYKYVHGKHGALTDNQEKLDMAADIRKYAEQYHKSKTNEREMICKYDNLHVKTKCSAYKVYSGIDCPDSLYENWIPIIEK